MVDELHDIAVSRARFDVGRYVELMRDEIAEYIRTRRCPNWGIDSTSEYRATLPRTVSIWYECADVENCGSRPQHIHGAIFGPYPGGKPGLWAD